MTDEQQLDSFVPFTPVSLRRRTDGWTPARQRAFIRHLIVYGNIESASKIAGISKTAAYNLRKRPDAESFARAWDMALRLYAEYKAAQRGDASRSRIRKRASSMTRKITNIDKFHTREYYRSRKFARNFHPKFTPAGPGI